MIKTPKEIYELLNEQLIDKVGYTQFTLMDISVNINDKSAIGYLFQEWLKEWMRKNNIDFRVKTNSQEFPDFLLHSDTEENGLLEIKMFDFDKSPNFDIANFEAYCRSVKEKPYRLDADYLIFGYTLHDAKITIKRIWLKKIWEITCPSERFPIKLQVKQDMIYNIRPAIWYSDRGTYKAFNSKKKFLEALYETLIKYEKTKEHSIEWLTDVTKNYLEKSGLVDID